MTDKVRRFICVSVPISACNLRCRYCYLRTCAKSTASMDDVNISPQLFRRAMSRDRLGGVSMFNFTATGETLIDRRIVPYIREILEEGHYVEVVTNATVTATMQEMANFPKELLSRLMFKCSFHFSELKERPLLEAFVSNVKLMRQAGASVTIELMPHDELLPYRDEILAFTEREFGAPCHVTVGRDASKRGSLPILTRLTRSQYQDAWKIFGSRLFEYKLSSFGCRQKSFCYAGEWMMFLDLGSGRLSQCYTSLRSVNAYGNIDRPLSFKAIGCWCCEPHCYNSHAWLTFGCIPTDGCAPYYADVRNRICSDGSEWLTPRMKSFLSQKFADNNPQYSSARKAFVNLEMGARYLIRRPLLELARRRHAVLSWFRGQEQER